MYTQQTALALLRAGERMAEMLALAPTAQVADWPTDQQIMAAVGAWNTAAQPIRDMISPNTEMTHAAPKPHSTPDGAR